MHTHTLKANLLDFDLAGLESYMQSLDEKPFRARQIFKWMHKFGVTDFDQMTDISVALRKRLQDCAVIEPLTIHNVHESKDGTIKWLFQLKDGNCIETVYIPEESRGTLCVSSQVGCALNCSFCSTATQGFNRNLTTAEIISQVFLAVRNLSKAEGKHDRHITNVVMMGMGEPLLNFGPVVNAMSIMLDDLAYGLSKRKVTLSTSGVVPQIYELAKTLGVSLAVSLHAPNDPLRDQLVPINKKYPLSELLEACCAYVEVDPHKTITMEYVMLDHINDSEEIAHELAQLLKNVPCKMNLIPFNIFPGTCYQPSSNNRIHRFKDVLVKAGYVTTIRRTRGDDVAGACGQLAGDFKDKTRRRTRFENAVRDRESTSTCKDQL